MHPQDSSQCKAACEWLEMQSKESNAHEMVGREEVVGLQRGEALGRRPENDSGKERIWGACWEWVWREWECVSMCELWACECEVLQVHRPAGWHEQGLLRGRWEHRPAGWSCVGLDKVTLSEESSNPGVSGRTFHSALKFAALLQQWPCLSPSGDHNPSSACGSVRARTAPSLLSDTLVMSLALMNLGSDPQTSKYWWATSAALGAECGYGLGIFNTGTVR